MIVDENSRFKENLDLSQKQSNTRAETEQNAPSDTKAPLQHDLATQILDDNKELVIHSSHKGSMTMPGTSKNVPFQQQSSSTFNPKILQRSGSNVPLIDIFLQRLYPRCQYRK